MTRRLYLSESKLTSRRRLLLAVSAWILAGLALSCGNLTVGNTPAVTSRQKADTKSNSTLPSSTANAQINSEALRSRGYQGATTEPRFTLPRHDLTPGLTFTLPRHDLTPGLTRPLTLQQICTAKWGLDHRFVTEKMKADVCKAYGAADCPGPNFEIDHLVPREDAGADDVKNLWPQPIGEAKIKDRVENWTHEMVCAIPPRLDLTYVQKTFEENWLKLLVLYQATRPAPRHPRPPAPQLPGAVPIPAPAGVRLTVMSRHN